MNGQSGDANPPRPGALPDDGHHSIGVRRRETCVTHTNFMFALAPEATICRRNAGVVNVTNTHPPFSPTASPN